MPFEERYIHFDLEEIQHAVSIGCVKENKDILPTDSKITKIEIDNENPEQQDAIFFILNNGTSEQRLSFDRKFFALSLVFFCQGSGIPIPAKGKKVLNIQEDKIVMKITLDGKKVEPHN